MGDVGIESHAEHQREEPAVGLTEIDRARATAGGRTRTIDLGQANGRLFALMLGVGFDADVAHRVARRRAPTPSSATSPPMRTAGPRLSGPRRRKCRTLVRSSALGDPPSPFA